MEYSYISPIPIKKPCCTCSTGDCTKCACFRSNVNCSLCRSQNCSRKPINIHLKDSQVRSFHAKAENQLDTSPLEANPADTPPTTSTLPSPAPHSPKNEPPINVPSASTSTPIPSTASKGRPPAHCMDIKAADEAQLAKPTGAVFNTNSVPRETSKHFPTILIGDDIISNVQPGDLTRKCTVHKINGKDYNALLRTIERENSYKNYIIVLTHCVENEDITKMANAIFAKNSSARIYMAEPTKLESIKQRHYFMNLCHSLKFRVIPTGKLRNRLTKTQDAGLFYNNSSCLNRKGTVKLLNIAARYVPQWVELLSTRYYYDYDHNMQSFACPPFLCFPPLHLWPPQLQTHKHDSANYTLLRPTPALPFPNPKAANYTHSRPAPLLSTPSPKSADYKHSRSTNTAPNTRHPAHLQRPAQKTRLPRPNKDSDNGSDRHHDATHSSSALGQRFEDEQTHAERFNLHSAQPPLTSLSLMAHHSKLTHPTSKPSFHLNMFHNRTPLDQAAAHHNNIPTSPHHNIPATSQRPHHPHPNSFQTPPLNHHRHLTYSLQSAPPHHPHTNHSKSATLHYLNTNSSHLAPPDHTHTCSLQSAPPNHPPANRFISVLPHFPHNNSFQSEHHHFTNSLHSAPLHHPNTNSSQSALFHHPDLNTFQTKPSQLPLTNTSQSAPNHHHHHHANNSQSTPFYHTYTNSSQSAPIHRPHNNSLQSALSHPPQNNSPQSTPFYQHHRHNNSAQSAPTHHCYSNSNKSSPPNHVQKNSHATGTVSHPAITRTPPIITSGATRVNSNSHFVTPLGEKLEDSNIKLKNTISNPPVISNLVKNERLFSHVLSQARVPTAQVASSHPISPKMGYSQSSTMTGNKNLNFHGYNRNRVLNNLKLQLMPTPTDGHCLIHALSKSLKFQIGYCPEQDIVSLLSAAWIEADRNKDYYSGFIKRNGCDGAYLRYMVEYFYNRNYNQPLGDLVPTMLSNALGLQIDIVQEDGFDNTTIRSIEPHLNNNKLGIKVFIHLKDHHYSALVPMQKFLKSPNINRTPNDLNFCSNKFAALNDAPDTCIYAEDAPGSVPNSQECITSSPLVVHRSNTNRGNSHRSEPKPK